jgi:prophage antirepressor-like protein
MFDLVPASPAGRTAVSRALPEGIATFPFDGKPVRVVDIDGEPWFVAKDALAVLYPRFSGNAGVAPYIRASLNADERRLLAPRNFLGPNWQTVFGSMTRSITVISESGLYKLILRANSSPTAKRFQDWVTRDALPAIRKDGVYVAGEEKVKSGEMERCPRTLAHESFSWSEHTARRRRTVTTGFLAYRAEMRHGDVRKAAESAIRRGAGSEFRMVPVANARGRLVRTFEVTAEGLREMARGARQAGRIGNAETFERTADELEAGWTMVPTRPLVQRQMRQRRPAA